jgi:5'-3' exonuclease
LTVSGISTLTAPYEADAQLAYMSKKKMIDCVLTTDSDQAFYGTDTVICRLKWDTGECNYFTRQDIEEYTKFSLQQFQW